MRSRADQRLLRRIRQIGAALPATPLVPVPHDTVELFVKLEYCNPNGSSKDRSAYWILRQAIERGDIRAGTTVVESSSGNFATSLASFCRMLDIAFVPVIDPNINWTTERQLRLTCPRVEKVEQPTRPGMSYLNTRLARVRELTQEMDLAYWPNQYANLDAVEAHDRLTGAELVRALADIDYAFVAVSTGGTITGLSRRLRRDRPRAQTIAVDVLGSAVFNQPPGPRRIPGIGSSFVPLILDRAGIDEVVIVSEHAAVDGCHRLLDRTGILAGGSTGAVYAAIDRYFANHRGPRPTVVFLAADRGTPYLDTVYNPAWVGQTLHRTPDAA